jgi:hypothetical protein
MAGWIIPEDVQGLAPDMNRDSKSIMEEEIDVWKISASINSM